MDDKTKLLNVAGPYRIGQELPDGSLIERIELVADGKGPMGWYDMVHFYVDEQEGPKFSIPAHDVGYREYL